MARLSGFWMVLALAGGVHAQRVLEPVRNIEEFRPAGSLRMWTFTHQAKDMGRLFSTVTSHMTIDGENALVIERRLSVDFALTGSPHTAAVQGASYVSPAGYYRGDNVVITSDSLSERLSMEYVDGALRGFFTRGAEEVERTVTFPPDRYAWEYNLVDQLEIFLARQRIAVGESFVDTLYQPQAMTSFVVSGEVSEFVHKELYKGKFDSVFVIHLEAPQPFDCYFTPDRRLARVDFVPQRIRVYLDLDTRTQVLREQAGERGWQTATSHTLHWIAFLLVGALGVLFFARRIPRPLQWSGAIVLGAAAFAVSLVTQVPLQKWLAEQLVPHGQATHVLSYGRALVPALAGAVIQELLKLGGILVIARWMSRDRETLIVAGTILGAAFGFLEAFYRLGFVGGELFGWETLERTFLVLFHTTSAAMLAASFRESRRNLTGVVLTLVAVNGIMRFLPALVHHNDATPELVSLLSAGTVVLLMIVALVLRTAGKSR